MSLILVLGGTRSGKSVFAEILATDAGAEGVLYVATAMNTGNDAELDRRVREHRERRPAEWGTFELGGGELGSVLEEGNGWDVVLFDSLTMWAAARMSGAEQDRAVNEFEDFVREVESGSGTFLVVSDEVGLGVVPESAEGREFRDLLGLLNQRAASSASEVYLCVAGIPMKLK